MQTLDILYYLFSYITPSTTFQLKNLIVLDSRSVGK